MGRHALAPALALQLMKNYTSAPAGSESAQPPGDEVHETRRLPGAPGRAGYGFNRSGILRAGRAWLDHFDFHSHQRGSLFAQRLCKPATESERRAEGRWPDIDPGAVAAGGVWPPC